MIIYISLPISGHDLKERSLRGQYLQEQLRKQYPQAKVINPLPGVKEDADQYPWEYYMANDILMLIECTHIYLDEGWQDSKGCKLEAQIAKIKGIERIGL